MTLRWQWGLALVLVLAGCLGSGGDAGGPPTRPSTDGSPSSGGEGAGNGTSDPGTGEAPAGATDDGSDGEAGNGTGPWIHGPGGQPRARSAYPGSLPSFAVRDVPGLAFEPTVGVAPDGSVFFEGMTSGEVPHPRVLRSRDRGNSWTDVTPSVGPAPRHPITNDPFLHVDHRTGRVFQVDMHVPGPCTMVSWSGDGGETWVTNPSACPSLPTDHPNLFTVPAGGDATEAGYPNVVLLCGSDAPFSPDDPWEMGCTRSLDGGTTWAPPVTVYEAPGCEEGPNAGHGTGGPEGAAYLPHVTCDVVTVHVSTDGGSTWTGHVVDDTLGGLARHHEARVAVDGAGNAYVTWIAEDGLPYLSASTDGGRNWSAPVSVAAPGVEASRFPSVAAGSPGRVAVQYLSPQGNDTWHGYVGVTLDAIAPSPTFATARVTPAGDPLQEGGCQDRCGGVGDFLDLVAEPGPEGRLLGALVDTCPDGCSGEQIQGGPYGQGLLAVQTGGTGLRAG